MLAVGQRLLEGVGSRAEGEWIERIVPDARIELRQVDVAHFTSAAIPYEFIGFLQMTIRIPITLYGFLTTMMRIPMNLYGFDDDD